mgnify:CR=1 FL=1
MTPPRAPTATELVLATARNAFTAQKARVREALKTDLMRMALAAAGTETGRALLAAAPPEAQEFFAGLLAKTEAP